MTDHEKELEKSCRMEPFSALCLISNGFYSTPGCGIDEARLAYVLKCEDIEKAIAILGEGLKVYPGRK